MLSYLWNWICRKLIMITNQFYLGTYKWTIAFWLLFISSALSFIFFCLLWNDKSSITNWIGENYKFRTTMTCVCFDWFEIFCCYYCCCCFFFSLFSNLLYWNGFLCERTWFEMLKHRNTKQRQETSSLMIRKKRKKK